MRDDPERINQRARIYRFLVHLDKKVVVAALSLGSLLPLPALAQDDDNEFRLSANARVRFEEVEQDNALLDATAFTLRLRAGLETPDWNGISGFAEFEGVTAFGSEDFNSGSNGRTQFSAVLDPEDVELNQLLLRYRNGGHYLQAGRQRMALDNSRFFGDVGYRQNQQTYDALTYMNTVKQGHQLRYAYMTKARRFLSDEHPVGEIDMNSHLLNYQLQRLNGDAFVAYAYLIDMDTAAVAQNSTVTIGLRYNGTWRTRTAEVLYAIEYAQQSDYADGASIIDADYISAEVGIKFSNEWVAKVGHERLGGDGTYGFQTPFGTNHAFNGFADIFAAGTPPTGVVDTSVKLTAPIAGARVLLAVHDFSADSGGADLGSEFNLTIEKRFAERFGISLLYADYRADSFSVDTTKWALWLDFRY